MKLARNVLLMCMCGGLMAGVASMCEAAGPIEVDDVFIERIDALDSPSVSALMGRKAAVLAGARDSKAAMSKKNNDSKEKVVVVDCDKGDSLQDAIDNNADPVVIEVHGICDENVLVRRRDDLTIRGTDPAVDGIRGAVADPQPIGALELRYSDQIRLENLSMNDSPRGGLTTVQSSIIVENCWIIGNASTGIVIRESSNFQGFGLTISENGNPAQARGFGLYVTDSSAGICAGCNFTDNARYAAVSNWGSVVSLLQSVVNGSRGIVSFNESYIDIDCISYKDLYQEYEDCSLDVYAWAATSELGAEAVIYDAGPFTGGLYAKDGARVWLYGAQQLSTSGKNNQFHDTSVLKVEPFSGNESTLNGYTIMRGFSRALLYSGTTVDGILECVEAGDAWAEPGVSYTDGSEILNCEHAPYLEPEE